MYVNTKAFYLSENGITQLINTLASLFSDFSKLSVKEKNKKFDIILKKCRQPKNKSSKGKLNVLDTKEEDVCAVIKNIDESLKEFRRNNGFATLVNVSVCEKGFPCPDGVDITEQFIKEYNITNK